MKIWIKWSNTDRQDSNYGKIYWKLYDIDGYELKIANLQNGSYKQSLHREWYIDDYNHGIEDIDLKDYPLLSSKEQLMMICNIERPYIDENNKK